MHWNADVTSRASERQESDDDKHISQRAWVKNIKEEERLKAENKIVKHQNTKVRFNYGVMHDFFAYSATCVQFSYQEVNLSQPPCPAGIRGGISNVPWKQLQPQFANIFAIAKVGVSNLIMPNTLDVKLSNY